MFASLYAYQIVNIVVALVAVVLLRRFLPPAFRDRLKRALGPLAATEFRRLWFLEAPLFALFSALAVVGSGKLFYPWFHRSFPEAPVDGAEVMFVAMGMAWYGGLLVFPAYGLWLAFGRRGDGAPRGLDRGLAGLSAALCGGLMYWVMCFEPNNVVVEPVRVGLESWPEDRAPLRVVVLADVQSPVLGERERRIPEMVAELAPDMILIPGDLIAQSLDADYPIECGRYLATKLHAPLGVYAVNGDVDMFVEGGLAKVLEGTGVRLLDNERIDLGGGVILDGCDPRDARPYRSLVSDDPGTSVRIAMVHRPRHVHELGREGADLVIAGHTHGGQIALPGFGPPVTLSPLPREVAAGGLHRIADTLLYVSRGIGMEAGFAPPMRFNCPPEITLLEIGPPLDGDESSPEIAQTAARVLRDLR